MNPMTVQFLPSDDPHGRLLEQFVRVQFPEVSGGNTEDILESVMTEFLGTKACRLGPKPNIESQFIMREVVRQAINQGVALPVLIPSAAAKRPLSAQIDLAEMSAISMIGCLNDRIRRHYAPGLDVRIRMEDATKHVIADGDYPSEHVDDVINGYVTAFTRLIKVMGHGDFITPVLESVASGGLSQFISKADDVLPLFERYLNMPNDQHRQDLELAGWGGGLSTAMLQYFYDRYARLYPKESRESHHYRMAQYFASILARRQLRGEGRHDGWPRTLELSFAPPMPDAPRVAPRVYYRTAVRNGLAPHMAYWTARGVFAIGDDDRVRLHLLNWYDTTPTVKASIMLDNGIESVEVQSDYMIEGG